MLSTVRQHYVPRTYLKAWADARGQVRVEDRVSERDFSSSPENVCVERFYYEADATRPDNAIEKMFQPYESNYDPHAATLNAIAASGSNIAQVTADLATAGADASLDTAIKGLAAVAYFRTPAALEALQNELKHDQSDAAQAAALASQTPHDMAKLAFDSTLLKRFQGLVPTYFFSKTRLYHLRSSLLSIAVSAVVIGQLRLGHRQRSRNARSYADRAKSASHALHGICCPPAQGHSVDT
ncbi:MULTISPECIES: DUF4238 domain-containing protein [Xanthomonas]|uniref:DUF4238 domain-containing protein n=1 Tax=Xanthomonas TaxID=338 RepID=UPI0009BE88BF|nr:MULTISPECIES: DUF4238 domain-containing protein [Xanthomonas]